MNTTAPAVMRGFEDHLVGLELRDMRSLDDRFIAVWGDDVEALKAIDRERVLMVLPKQGPAPRRGGSRCVDLLWVVVCVRYAVTREGRDRMLDDIAALRTHARGAIGVVPGLREVTFPSEPTYSYRTFEGQNAAVAFLPVLLEYHVAVSAAQGG